MTRSYGNGVVPDSNRLTITGTLMATMGPMSQADVILLLGSRINFSMMYGRFFPPGVKIIQVDIEPTELGINRGPDVGIHGDIKVVLEQLDRSRSRHAGSRLGGRDNQDGPRGYRDDPGRHRHGRRSHPPAAAGVRHTGRGRRGGCLRLRRGRYPLVRRRDLSGRTPGQPARHRARLRVSGRGHALRPRPEAGQSGSNRHPAFRGRDLRVERHGVRHGRAARDTDRVRHRQRSGLGDDQARAGSHVRHRTGCSVASWVRFATT